MKMEFPQNIIESSSFGKRQEELRQKFLDNTITDEEIEEMASYFPHAEDMTEQLFVAKRSAASIGHELEAAQRNERRNVLDRLLNRNEVEALDIAREQAEEEDKRREERT